MADPPVVALNGHSQVGHENVSDHVMKDSSEDTSDETINKDMGMAGSDSDHNEREGEASSPDETLPNGKVSYPPSNSEMAQH